MSDLEQRLKKLEDRDALYDVLIAYYTAVDSLSDLDGLVKTFSEDAVFDLTGLGLDSLHGHGAIRAFFKNVFDDVTHHAHHVSNFRVDRIGDHDASGHAYVLGRAMARSGTEVFVSCWIDIGYERAAGGWKMKSFVEGSLMPLPDEVGVIHGKN